MDGSSSASALPILDAPGDIQRILYPDSKLSVNEANILNGIVGEISNWIAIVGDLKVNHDANTAQYLIDSLQGSRDKLSQILRPRILKAQYSDSTVDPFQKQITAMLTKLEELLRECKDELDGGEYCNIEDRLVAAKTLIRLDSDCINFFSQAKKGQALLILAYLASRSYYPARYPYPLPGGEGERQCTSVLTKAIRDGDCSVWVPISERRRVKASQDHKYARIGEGPSKKETEGPSKGTKPERYGGFGGASASNSQAYDPTAAYADINWSALLEELQEDTIRWSLVYLGCRY
ncbi:hypothetical protein V502_01550 [Pseudogymnoascus sp. VKM F-4520 (FW-2644)]|nr:hypothetical protein V502_01550 [Pseudogymnoascus sp. VKM F-4520 (FW-2644)]